ncbi:MAG TPA: family 78 glycoside hydrolase catalytic domain [Woeseiaceae bacterium]|nr:family 78 glycoside hydrolase catalytic domain [Woeseiaceae bacterium]
MSGAGAPGAPPPGLSVADLRSELTTNLLGTEVPRPRLSWRLESTRRGVFQRAYRIRAASDPGTLARGAPLSWDSGVVESRETFDVSYGGPALAAMQRWWWDVEITDDRGHTARAAPAWMEAGLLAADDWRADWLEAEDELAAADRAANVTWIWGREPLDARLHAFRVEFDAPADLVTAEILVAGKDQLAGVWLNGEAAAAPRLLYWGTMLPFRADVRPGRNILGVAVLAETAGFFPVDGGALAVLVRLHRANGTIERRASGTEGDWRVMPDPPDGWQSAAFDVAAWPAARPAATRPLGDPRPPEPAMLLRTQFRARAGLAAARLYATALGAYDARLNGQAVADNVLAPEISVADRHVLYQCYDVGHLVAPGENALAFTVADGFYASAFGWRMERYGLGPAPRRLRAQLKLDYADGSTEWVVTGPGWRIAESALAVADIYGGEVCDARRSHDGWDRPGFDDAGWRTAEVGVDPGVRLVAQTSPPLRPRQRLRACSVAEPLPGRFVFDFGQNFSGWARLCATGTAGTRIELRYAEVLAADGTVDQANLRRAEATDVFVLRGDVLGEVFEPRFTYHGFRYVEVRGYPGAPTAGDLEGIAVYSDCAETGAMEFDSPLLAQVWQNAFWSQRANFFGVPTDCPQRDERMGWMGDIQVFLDAAAFNMDVDGFIRRFLGEVRAAQFADGGYPIVVPVPRSFPEVVTAGWSEAGVILPHGLWWRYGDTAVIEENWGSMERWMEFLASRNPDGIWRNERGLDLGDWLSVDARVPDEETTPRVLCATAYWAFCARLMAEMADATGRADAAAHYGATFERIKAAFGRELVSADGVAGNGSQASQVLALYMDLVPDDLRSMAARVLAEEIAGRGMKLSTGFLGTPYLLDVLADAGELDTVRDLLLQTGYPSWGYMASSGATTVWERWNSDVGDLAMNSYNHYALGAVIGFYYRRLAGIAPAAPGFRRIAVRPLWLPEIGGVAARYDAVVGRIATTVAGDADGIGELALTVPPNCVAEIELPAGFEWHEDDVSLHDCAGLMSHYVGGGVLHAEVASGEYRFARR